MALSKVVSRVFVIDSFISGGYAEVKVLLKIVSKVVATT